MSMLCARLARPSGVRKGYGSVVIGSTSSAVMRILSVMWTTSILIRSSTGKVEGSAAGHHRVFMGKLEVGFCHPIGVVKHVITRVGLANSDAWARRTIGIGAWQGGASGFGHPTSCPHASRPREER